MVAFPLGKLIYLGIRQLSKPIARQLQSAAKRSPIFRRFVCAPPAQGQFQIAHSRHPNPNLELPPKTPPTNDQPEGAAGSWGVVLLYVCLYINWKFEAIGCRQVVVHNYLPRAT